MTRDLEKSLNVPEIEIKYYEFHLCMTDRKDLHEYDSLHRQLKIHECLRNLDELLEIDCFYSSNVYHQVLARVQRVFGNPETVCCRIFINNWEIRSRHFRESSHTITTEICLKGRTIGTIDIFYTGSDINEFRELTKTMFIHKLADKLKIVEYQRQQEENYINLKQQLHQLQKREVIGRLACGVAHNFNNILTVINGYSKYLIEKLENCDESYPEISEIHKAGLQGAELIRQLFELKSFDHLELKYFDLNEVLRNLKPMMTSFLGGDVKLHLALHTQPASILSNVGQTEQIILNLLVNAKDAMPRGGKLEISTAVLVPSPTESGDFSDVALRSGEYVKFTIKDTGTGMPPEVERRIFEPFFTTKDEGMGTGLGLSMAHGFIRHCEGQIKVDSNPGQGTTFSILLPYHEPTNITCDNIEDSDDVDLSGDQTVLVVDDDASVRKVIVDILRCNGYIPLQAFNGKDAIEMLKSNLTSIDLLITDIVMPEMNGWLLCEEVIKMCPTMPIMCLSSYLTNDIKKNIASHESITFMYKPFDTTQLLTLIKKIVQSIHLDEIGSPLPPPIYNEDNRVDKKVVMIVSSRKNEIKNIFELLEDLGHVSFSYESGANALTDFEEIADVIDCVILDRIISDTTNTKLAVKLLEINAGLQVVYLCESDAETDTDDVYDGIQLCHPVGKYDLQQILKDPKFNGQNLELTP